MSFEELFKRLPLFITLPPNPDLGRAVHTNLPMKISFSALDLGKPNEKRQIRITYKQERYEAKLDSRKYKGTIEVHGSVENVGYELGHTEVALDFSRACKNMLDYLENEHPEYIPEGYLHLFPNLQIQKQ